MMSGARQPAIVRAMGMKMTDPTKDHAMGRTARVKLARFFRIAMAGAPAILTVGTVTGLGLLRGLPLGLALLGGLALTLLPILGLAGRAGPRRLAPVGAAWLWCVLLLVSLPLYFPGERDEAAREGFRTLGSVLGAGAAQQLGSAGGFLVGLLGSDPQPAQPIAMDSPPLSPQAAFPRADSEPPAPAGSRLGLAKDYAKDNAKDYAKDYAKDNAKENPEIELSYEGDESSLRIAVDVDGPEVGEGLMMVFDTGATLTTLDRASLRAIGVAIPPDAPRVTLQTAGGLIEADLVLVDAIWLGSEGVEWITVAVCDSCASPPAAGLLGLNVSQRFQVSINHDRQAIALRRRRGADDRSLDIRNWIQIRSEAQEAWNGRVDVELTVFNSSRQEIESAVVHLECTGAGFAIQVDAIPPHGEASTQAELPRGTDCRQQEIELSRANWKLDRFE